MSACVWFAPGRANLMGEHTDYNEGLVLPFALAQGVTATAVARPDRLLVMRSKQVPAIHGHGAPRLAATGLGERLGGLSRRRRVVAARRPGAPCPAPPSTSTPTCPWARGSRPRPRLSARWRSRCAGSPASSVPRRELAAIAKRAENEFVGAPTGIIDQSAALLCQAGHAMLLDCGTLAVTQVPFEPGRDGMATLIVDTRVTHALVSGEYASRRAECEAAARLLGVPFLGSVTDVRVADRLSDPVLRRRARHVISDSGRARAIAAALLEALSTRASTHFVGQLLTEAAHVPAGRL